MADGKHPRIGVYICHCGGNISDYVDVKKVAEDIAKEDNVVVAKDVIFACSDSSQNEMVEDVKANKLDRLIVASCSPRLHEITFRNVSQRAGLNPYTYYHVNIREQSSWAHTDDREGATEKALRQVRSAVAYSRLSEPLEGIKAQSTPAVMVVGGGIAGLRAAIDLADSLKKSLSWAVEFHSFPEYIRVVNQDLKSSEDSYMRLCQSRTSLCTPTRK
jgi:heterodisulfide reductase subunit A